MEILDPLDHLKPRLGRLEVARVEGDADSERTLVEPNGLVRSFTRLPWGTNEPLLPRLAGTAWLREAIRRGRDGAGHWKRRCIGR